MLGLPLEKQYLSETDAARLYRNHPEIKASFERFCPTCRKKGPYEYRGKMVECDCQGQLNLHKQYLNSGIGVLYQRLTWDDFHGEAILKENIDTYIEHAERLVDNGIGLIVTGPVGCGKTMMTTLLLKYLMRQGYPVFSTTFTGMIEMYTDGWVDVDNKAFFHEKMTLSRILLLDDLGKERRNSSKLAESTFDHVLRSRVQNGRPTFITTNMNNDDMRTGYGGAVMSLLDETSITVEVKGEDVRRAIGTQRVFDAMDGYTRPIT